MSVRVKSEINEVVLRPDEDDSSYWSEDYIEVFFGGKKGKRYGVTIHSNGEFTLYDYKKDTEINGDFIEILKGEKETPAPSLSLVTSDHPSTGTATAFPVGV